MDRTKHRIADLDARIRDNAGDVDQLERLQFAKSRFRELAAAIGPELPVADWQRRREIIRTLVQQIDTRDYALNLRQCPPGLASQTSVNTRHCAIASPGQDQTTRE